METAESYSKKGYEQLSVTVDLVIFTVIDNELKVLLIKRGQEPFIDFWALPGGFVRINESLEEAALRELKEETGIQKVYLEQLYTFGNPKRDPRGRVVSVSYMALMPENAQSESKSHVETKWVQTNSLPGLAYDHNKIVDYAINRLRAKIGYTNIAQYLLPDRFTLSELQSVYEIVTGKELDKRNFRKKILASGMVRNIKLKKKEGVMRPAALYTFSSKEIKTTDLI